MWEKFKRWLSEHKEARAEKKFKKWLDIQIGVNQLLDEGPNWMPYNIHEVPTLICSVYFESDKDWVAVDFSQEDKGIVHYMSFTPKKITDYKAGERIDPNKKEIHTIMKDAYVFMKYYADGSEGWCFSL